MFGLTNQKHIIIVKISQTFQQYLIDYKEHKQILFQFLYHSCTKE
jgi:hypothetical protein